MYIHHDQVRFVSGRQDWLHSKINYYNLSCANSFLILCDPVHCSPPGSSVPTISQARILEWVAISFSRGSSWPRD